MSDPLVELMELDYILLLSSLVHFLRIFRYQPLNKERRLADYHWEHKNLEKVVFQIRVVHFQNERRFRFIVNFEVLKTVPILNLLLQITTLWYFHWSFFEFNTRGKNWQSGKIVNCYSCIDICFKLILVKILLLIFLHLLQESVLHPPLNVFPDFKIIFFPKITLSSDYGVI